MHERFPSPHHNIEETTPISELVSEARDATNLMGRVPEGYSLFHRDVQLLNGNREPAFYSTHVDQRPNPEAWERSSGSIVAAFVWALETPKFANNELDDEPNEPSDDDRTQEIGNMMSYAIAEGLTEEQVLACLEVAYAIAQNTTD